MVKIKAVIFDVGGVLTRETLVHHYEPMCISLNINFNKFLKIREKYVGKARVGKISTKKYLSLIAKDLKINYNYLLREWLKYKIKDFKIHEDVKKTIKKLKKNGYIVGSLTNIIELHHNIRKIKGVYDLFDFNICSYQVGLGKPREAMYGLLLKKLKSIDRKIKETEVIFIDDHESCIKGAVKFGIRGVLYKNNEQLTRALKKLNINL